MKSFLVFFIAFFLFVVVFQLAMVVVGYRRRPRGPCSKCGGKKRCLGPPRCDGPWSDWNINGRPIE